MKKLLILAAIALLAGCTSNSEQKGIGPNGLTDSMTADLNSAKTNTIFDSIPREALPYADSISLDDATPLKKMEMSRAHMTFLKIRNIREFNEYYSMEPDSAFQLICRLPISGNYFSVLINFTGQNESMNYLINYDREFRVVDYIMTAYAENMETALRTSTVIDSTGMTISTNNVMKEPASLRSYKYTISDEGFFREETGMVADKN